MNRRFQLAVWGLFLSLILLLPGLAWAQFGAGVQGVVQDPQGAAVPSAKVTLKNQATGVTQTTTTTGAGVYRFAELGPGLYTVTVEATGFQQNETKNVNVKAEQITGLNIRLKLGQVTQTVTVSAESQPQLQTTGPTITGTFTSQEIKRLPLFNRDPYEAVRLAPGIFGDGSRVGNGNSTGFPNGPGSNPGGQSAGPGGSNSAIFQTENQQPISANGQRVTSNSYMVNGVSVNSLQWGGAAVLTPSPGSVQEMTVVSNDYDAADGPTAGAHVKVDTQSGTNKFHGSGFFQYEEPGLNAYNKFGGYEQGVGFLPPLRNDDAFRQFGASLGGPVLKNKLFFFFNYEGLRDFNTTYQDNWIDTTQFDSLLAKDRAGTPVAKTLTASGIRPRVAELLPSTCATWIAANQPCQVVNGGVDVGSPGLSYGTYIPSFNNPNFTGGGLDGIPDFQFARLSLPSHNDGNQYNARVDYHVGANQFSGSTFLTYYNSIGPGPQSRPMGDIHSNRFSPSGFLSWVRTISPSMMNEARFNFTRYGFNELSSSPNVNWAIPRTEIQGLPIPGGQRIIFGADRGDTTPGVFAENTFAFRDILQWIRGQHSMKFGMDVAHQQNNDHLTYGSSRPDYVFQGPWNFANGAPIYEAINVNPATGGPTSGAPYYRTTDYGVFFQDDWQYRPNLTLNLGLRWDYFGPPSSANGRLVNILLPSGPNGLTDAYAVNPKQQWGATWRNLGPRIGFAWSPEMTHQKAVIRGGFGMGYDRFDDDAFDNSRNNPPYVANYGICCGTASTDFGTPFVNGQILYETGTSNSPLSFPANPALKTPLNPNTGLPEVLPGQGAPDVFVNPQNMPIPYIYFYSFDVQYALPKAWTVTVGYSGSSSHKLLRIRNLKYFYASDNNSSINNVFSFTPDTNAHFNALGITGQHLFHGGYLLNMNYTFSRCIDQVSSQGPGFDTNQTYPTDASTEIGPCDYDATHNIRIYALWSLPIFRNQNTLTGKLLGGWQVAGTFQFHSGFPWTPVSQNNCFTLGSSFLCPVRPVGYNGGAGANYSTGAFLPPTSSNFPNGATSYFNVTTQGFPGIGRNSFRGPRYTGFDLSFVKSFGLPAMPFVGEDSRINLRLNIYNVFNKLNLAPFVFGSASTIVSYYNNENGPVSNPQFGSALGGLQGRVLELQANYSF
jgi:hypothetical protein